MKNLFPILFSILLLFSVSQTKANILYVPAGYPTIQSAMNSAVNGDTILVAQGTYYENVNFRGKGVVLASYYLINHDTGYISSTIINGGTPLHPDTASCVLMYKPDISYASDTSAALVGFTLTQGNGTLWEDKHYPGYFFREGGGILIEFWSPRIRFNRIIGNHIDTDTLHPNGGGGAIRGCDGNPIIENNIIQYNSGHCGTAINLYFCSGTIRNNIINGNYGAHIYGGGAIYTYKNLLSYPIIIENNTIVNNYAIVQCGGVRTYESANVTIKNNIIWGNVYFQILNSGLPISVTYCNVQDGYTGTGNINVAPQFVTNSFNLIPNSDCVDAGDSNTIYNDPEDPLHPGLALLPALGTTRNDMGAFGGPGCTVLGSTVIGIKNNNITSNVTDFTLYQNFPNPFNPVTTISYQLPAPGYVEIKIYNINGQEIKTLINNNQKEGHYSVLWEGNDNYGSKVSSGVYFYRMTVKTNSQSVIKTRKMILIK
ncbi:MAG: T9SS type A sorting domain-containing protein [Ignavibacteria bacterium]|nr:T9SS type A sorting domain-containing protein [Ignavibacteria bacterium]